MKTSRWVFYGVGLAGLALVLIAIGTPVVTALLITAIFACPAMMFFMMGDHGDHGDHGGGDADRSVGEDPHAHHHSTSDSAGSLR
jgi:hypothetical protein